MKPLLTDEEIYVMATSCADTISSLADLENKELTNLAFRETYHKAYLKGREEAEERHKKLSSKQHFIIKYLQKVIRGHRQAITDMYNERPIS